MNLYDTFRCRARRQDVTVDVCESDFCAANAVKATSSACYRCPQGQAVRTQLAREAWPRRFEILEAFMADLLARARASREVE